MIFGSCMDLRQYQEDPKTQAVFQQIITGKAYVPVEKKCKACQKVLKGSEKFCPECGARVEG